MDYRSKKTYRQLILFSVSLLFSASLIAQTVIESKGMTVTGYRELPKVLYIVPWKTPSADKDLIAPNSDTLMADVLDPLDREIFKRRIEYFDLMQLHDEAP